MNTLRICGVGVYESEEFYDYAAEKGILIWQDLMFSCTLYPMDDEFIENVKTEVRQQIWRLRKHTSILTFNANNENELAIRKHWYKADNYTEKQQVSDYVALYVNVISPIVKKLLDSSHPFLLSSPSNGIETVIEGGIAQNPGDTRFGDIHFYNDQLNLWQDSTYLTPRCATEYGVQSLPLNFTMLKWINEKDYSYMSPTFENRQHGTGQTISNLALIFSHLPIPSSCANYTRENITKCTAINSTEFLNRFSYLSQINHAITLKVQTEHYRRFRNQTNEVGEGNTMCAMYWQLNDVWAAPTPSSIDFELKWKATHYEARRFFDQLIVALFARGHNLGVTIVNDEVNEIKGAKLVVNLYAWSKGFDPLSSIIQFVDIPALSAKTFYFERFAFALNDKKSDYLFEAYVEDEQGRRLTQRNYLYPDKFYEVDLGRLGNVAIESAEGSSDGLSYIIKLSSTGLSPFTWIDIGIPYLGWLSDNSFTMTTPTKTVKLHLVKPLKLSKDDFTICNMKNCGLN
ncbi:hypothetical protein WR25_26696 [Diploscapter pachys]|uniref:beta-mannosidase n=1 Tax=Diploscapter pachys TaxID=2018661 RepID=A0A2A2L8R2_9BILA|nr:hypothetical protein WR25_26696 [Diploscapter pachys]